MAFNSLPLLFYNLGGEMLYVLDQRLLAQKIPADKAEKVMADIVTTMFNNESLKEMEKPQVLYSKQVMRTIFTKIVHSSIMKVNTDSMEKLFDLMIMAVKYQFVQCNTATELIHSTLNRIESVLPFVTNYAHVTVKVKKVFKRIVEAYGGMSAGEFVLVRQALLTFVQDSNNKVSIYLNKKKQNDEGKFILEKQGDIPAGSDVPGTIHLFKKGRQSTVHFDSGCNFNASVVLHDLSEEIGGKRCSSLGMNLYKECPGGEYNVASNNSMSSIASDSCRLANAELGLLALIIGSNSTESNKKEFHLDLFSSNHDLPVPQTSSKDLVSERNVVNITATKYGSEQLSQIADDFTINATSPTTSRGEDLLSLMDL